AACRRAVGPHIGPVGVEGVQERPDAHRDPHRRCPRLGGRGRGPGRLRAVRPARHQAAGPALGRGPGRRCVMKDPHIHVERTPITVSGQLAIRTQSTDATAWAPDFPKRVAPGAGNPGQLPSTSAGPKRVTGLACRDYARAEYLTWAAMAEAAAQLAEAEPRA